LTAHRGIGATIKFAGNSQRSTQLVSRFIELRPGFRVMALLPLIMEAGLARRGTKLGPIGLVLKIMSSQHDC
jgi:hypothetical protein